eukprot:1180795-Prorocentrum_minimum.AAC.1
MGRVARPVRGRHPGLLGGSPETIVSDWFGHESVSPRNTRYNNHDTSRGRRRVSIPTDVTTVHHTRVGTEYSLWATNITPSTANIPCGRPIERQWLRIFPRGDQITRSSAPFPALWRASYSTLGSVQPSLCSPCKA